MRKVLGKNIVLFAAGFGAYCLIELLWRGYTYFTMGCCGGLAVVVLDKINDYISWDTPLELQAAAGMVLITAMELVTGTVSQVRMWDYSDMPLNYRGVICLPFSLAWWGLSVVAVMMADCINYYVLRDGERPRYVLFGWRFCLPHL